MAKGKGNKILPDVTAVTTDSQREVNRRVGSDGEQHPSDVQLCVSDGFNHQHHQKDIPHHFLLSGLIAFILALTDHSVCQHVRCVSAIMLDEAGFSNHSPEEEIFWRRCRVIRFNNSRKTCHLFFVFGFSQLYLPWWWFSLTVFDYS